MNVAIYEHLVDVAKSGKTTLYGDLFAIAGLHAGNKRDMDSLGKILEDIAAEDVKAGRPLLAALVVRADTHMPGKGLHKWAKSNGLQKDGDDIKFFVEELRRVHDFYRSP